MDEHETPINSQETRPGRLRAGGSRLFRVTEERLIWPLEDAGRAVFEVIRRPFEWLAWALQRALIWPLQDRLDGLGRPARAAIGVTSLVAVAAIVAIGIGLLGSGSGEEPEPASELVAEPAPQIAAAPAPDPEPEPEPETLEGVSPTFKPSQQKTAKQSGGGNGDGSGDGPVAAAEKQAEAVTESASGSAATDTISSSPANSSDSAGASASASASSQESGRPAGKKALAVAREFADAFVVYETGGEVSDVRKAFKASATKELSRSLLRRPPRLPANVKVPKAKVVNVVAGPSHAGIYPISVSLLRVGLTSELRLEMERLDGQGWRVTNVLG